MKKSNMDLLRGAIHAGLEFEYPTVFGKTAKGNPYDVEQKDGQVYLIFAKRDGSKIKRKIETCFALKGSPGFAELNRAGMIEEVSAAASRFRK